MKALLDNIVWHSLSGPHSRFAAGSGRALRYARGFSPIVGFEDNDDPDFAALAPFCEAGERFYTDGWSGPAPAGWRIEVESTMRKMVWAGAPPEEDAAPGAVLLSPVHAQRALDLALLTRPGPFGLRTPELGEYFGVFEGERLLAMAGERMTAGPWREVSGVCTDPGAQGRGLARALVLKLVRRQLARGEKPFLHVMSDNARAIGLYERMGFRTYRESVVRVVAPD